MLSRGLAHDIRETEPRDDRGQAVLRDDATRLVHNLRSQTRKQNAAHASSIIHHPSSVGHRKDGTKMSSKFAAIKRTKGGMPPPRGAHLGRRLGGGLLALPRAAHRVAALGGLVSALGV